MSGIKALFSKNILFVSLFLFISIDSNYTEAGEKIEYMNPPADCGANWTEDINECKRCHSQDIKMSDANSLSFDTATDECGGNPPYEGPMQMETTSDGKLVVTHPDTTATVGTNQCFGNTLKINGYAIAYYYYEDGVVKYEDWWPDADTTYTRRHFYPADGIHNYKVRVIYCSSGAPSCGVGWIRITKEWAVNIEKREEPEQVKIPLGKEITVTDNDKIYRIYIPSSSGGIFTIETNNETIELYYPDIFTKIAGPDVSITYSIPFEDADGNPIDKHGWYYVKHNDTGTAVVSGFALSNTIISNTFKEIGEASYRPWNFWYYPLQNQSDPARNLYGEGGTLTKYDAAFAAKAREYELLKNSNGGESWVGHCWGATISSILLSQPQPIYYNGQNFSQDEIEGLVMKLGDTNADFQVLIDNIPAIKPQVGKDDTDKFADKFHAGLVEHIRKKRESLQSNLRDPKGLDSTQVWNHAIYKYISVMKEAEEGKEDIIKITTTIYANADIPPPSDDNTIYREETFVYKLKYKSKGILEDNFPEQDWIIAAGFAPKSLRFIKSSPFDGRWGVAPNPYVKKENVEKLGVDFSKSP
ncbi:MAG: hypothetical protein AB1498_06710 [bacterium]